MSSVTPQELVEKLGSMPECELLATPRAIPAARTAAASRPGAASARRPAWAKRMKRFFAIDALACPRRRRLLLSLSAGSRAQPGLAMTLIPGQKFRLYLLCSPAPR